MKVCVRCIFRLFGVHGPVYSCPLLTSSMLRSFLKEDKGFPSDHLENGLNLENDDGSYCSICLGILQLACNGDREVGNCEEKTSLEDFAARIAEEIRGENYQIDDGFSLEFSIPPVVVANERALW